MNPFSRFLTIITLMLILLLPGTAWAFDSGILNPDWRPGTNTTGSATSVNPSGNSSASGNPGIQVTPANDPVQQNINNKYFDPNGAQALQNEAGQLKNQMDQPVNPSSSSGTDLFKDPNFNDLNQSPPGTATNSNNSNSSGQKTTSQATGNNQNSNQKGKFGLLATLVCMGALFPISSAIRNIMMGFLTWLGVNEERTARQMAGTLSGLASVGHLAGSGLNSIIGKPGNTFGGNTTRNVGSKVPPIGGGVGINGMAGGPGMGNTPGGMPDTSLVSAGNSIVSAGGSTIAGNASSAGSISESASRSSGAAGSGKTPSVAAGGNFPGGDINSPYSLGVGKIEEAGSPSEAGTSWNKGTENNLASSINPLPAEASIATGGISDGLSGEKPSPGAGGMAPLYKDVLRNDNQSRKIYNAVAQAGNLADGFTPGSSKLIAATASNLAAVPMAAYQIAKGVSQIKREGNMTFRDAVKAYTNSNNWGTGLAKMAGGVAGSAAGMGPFGVTAVGASINAAGKTKDYAIAGGKFIGGEFCKITKTIFS